MSTSARIAQKWALAPLLVVSLAALVLSWHGLMTLGANAGLGSLSWLLPIVIDGLTISGALCVVVAGSTGDSAKFGWGLLLGGAVASVYGNVMASPTNDPASWLAHSAAPIALALSLEAWLRTVRREIAQVAEEEKRQARKVARAASQAHKAPVIKALDGPVPPSKKKNASVEPELITALTMAVESLPDDASLTARARAALEIETVSGGVLAQVLNISPAQAHKARERAMKGLTAVA